MATHHQRCVTCGRTPGLSTLLVHLLLYTEIGFADGANNLGSVLGPAVGISLATSLITTLITLLIAYLIHKHRRKKDSSIKLRDLNKGYEHGRKSDDSSRPLTRDKVEYQAVATNEKNGDLRKSRIRSDFIAKWCTDHSLSENTASILRDNGFITAQAIESLHINDIPQLGLTNLAQQCQLRKVICPDLRPSGSSGVLRQKSSSEEVLPSPGTGEHNNSTGSSMFERSQSMDQVDGNPGVILKPIGSRKSVRSKGSLEVIEDEPETFYRVKEGPVSGLSPGIVLRPQEKTKSNPKNFRGLLSDKGLHDLSAMIGQEYIHLATLIGIPVPVQEQIQMNHPKNTRQQIYEMLRLWRDTAKGHKEEVKGALHKALNRCGRTDLAEDLLQEQVDGSSEKMAYQSIV